MAFSAVRIVTLFLCGWAAFGMSPASGQSSPGSDAPAVKTVAPAQTPQISWPAAEILRMTQANLESSVITAYIDSFPYKYSLTAEEILYLRDMGVSEEIITAMLQHDVKHPDLAAAPEFPANVPTASPQPTTNYVGNAPAQVTTFYQDLAPYGSWIYLDNYGWCWQPDVVVRNRNWRPYFDDGRWIYSQTGWYWQSYYSWGWAPFHYGRWWYAPCGWVWFPDTVWAPSWTVWRYNGSYCGWAPLPPYPFPLHRAGAHFAANFGVHLGPSAYTFVGVNNVFAHHLRYHHVDYSHVHRMFPNTVQVNNFAHHGNVVANPGIPIRHVQRVTGKPVPVAQVAQTPVDPRRTSPDYFARTGRHPVVYQSQLPGSRQGATIAGQRLAPGQTSVRHEFGVLPQARWGGGASPTVRELQGAVRQLAPGSAQGRAPVLQPGTVGGQAQWQTRLHQLPPGVHRAYPGPRNEAAQARPVIPEAAGAFAPARPASPAMPGAGISGAQRSDFGRATGSPHAMGQRPASIAPPASAFEAPRAAPQMRSSPSMSMPARTSPVGPSFNRSAPQASFGSRGAVGMPQGAPSARFQGGAGFRGGSPSAAFQGRSSFGGAPGGGAARAGGMGAAPSGGGGHR